MRRIQAFWGLVLVVFALSNGSALAAAAPTATSSPAVPRSPFNVTVSPDAQELVAKPGGSVTTIIQLRNNGLQTEHLKATLMTFKAAGQNGVPQLVKPTAQDDFINWLSMSTPTFDAEPNVWQKFTVTINPPTTAAFGYYYAIVFSQTGQPTAAKGNTLVGSVVSLLLLDVKAPGEKRQANLTEFSTPNKVVEFLPEHFTIRMHNSGNIHVAPRGNIFIYKGNKMIGLIQVNSAEGNILPASNRVYSVQWSDGTPVYTTKQSTTSSGKATDKTSLDWSNFKAGKLRFGKYTAKIEMIYNNGKYDVPNQAQLSFWVIPWRIIAGVVIVLLLVLAGIWALIFRPLRGRIKQRGRGGNVRLR